MNATQWVLNLGILGLMLSQFGEHVATPATMRVGRNASGATTIAVGWAYAALWTLVVGGRIVFALWASGPGGRSVGSFSLANHITPDAWVPFFVLMALCMVAVRTATVGVRAIR